MSWILVGLLIWLAWKYLGVKRTPREDKFSPAPSEAARARAVLGVAADADAETIRRAHRRLVAAAHPDRGGSPEQARRINAARDLLLDRTG